MSVAEQTGLGQALETKVTITAPRIASGAANAAPELLTMIADMAAGAD